MAASRPFVSLFFFSCAQPCGVLLMAAATDHVGPESVGNGFGTAQAVERALKARKKKTRGEERPFGDGHERLTHVALVGSCRGVEAVVSACCDGSFLTVFFPSCAGITRDGLHKRRATGAKRTSMHKKRKFSLGRPAAMTRIGATRVHDVRARGGLIKHRAIRLENGNFSWGSEAVTKKTRIIEVVYNASNNELVRTNTLVKGAIVAIDAAPFVDWYKGYYGVALAKVKEAAPAAVAVPTAAELKKKQEKTAAKQAKQAEKEAKRQAKHKKAGTVAPEKKEKAAKKAPAEVTEAVRAQRAKEEVIDPAVKEQVKVGRVLARITSRPGQVGTCDGYILEGPELQFYLRKLAKKR